MAPVNPEIAAWTTERHRLLDWFHKNAPRLEAPYRAAVRLLHEPEFPARWHLLSHLVREISNGLPEAVAGRRIKRFESTKALDRLAEAWRREYRDDGALAGSEEPPSPSIAVPASLVRQVSTLVSNHQSVNQTNRDKTALLIDALRPGTMELRSALEPVLREWGEVVRWFVGQTHVPRNNAPMPEDEGELQRRFRHFEDGLHGITAGHFEVVRDVDAILESAPPSRGTLQRLLPFLGGAEQLRYFFRHPRLEDPAWLPVLEAAGFFKRPPEPVVRQETQIETTETHVHWPAAEYLVRMAEHVEAHEVVARIASKVRSANTTVRDNLMDIALRLPSKSAASLVQGLIENLQKTRWRFARAEKLAALADALATSGHVAAARRLLGRLVEVVPDRKVGAAEGSVFPPDARMHVQPRDLERAFDDHLPGIIAGLGIEGLEALSGSLAAALHLSREPTDDKYEDYSHIWRTEIETDGRHDVRGVLVTSVLRAAEQLIARDGTRTQRVLHALERRRWQVFKRLGLHLLAKHSSPPQELVAARLLDRTLFNGLSTGREYRVLLERSFGSLNEEQKAVWLSWVDAGVAAEGIRQSLQFWGREPSDSEVARVQRQWEWHRLGLIRDSLPAGWQQRWEALAREFGPPEPAAKIARSSSFGSFKWESPLTEERARAMTVSELTSFLKSWKRSSDQPFVSPQGLGEVVTSVVAQSAQHYSEEASAFEGVAPTYVRSVLSGFAQASNEGRSFDWSSVLALAEWIVRQPVVEPEPERQLHDEDPGWGWTRGAIIRLLEGALKKNPSPLPIGAGPAVWNLIETLCRDPSPQRRGDALETALYYASWVRAHNGQPWYGEGTLDDVPSVRAVLDHALSPSTPPSPRIHEAIGRQVPWLVFMDEAWVRLNLVRIFPEASEGAALWHAAWGAYLASAPVKDRVFGALTPVYREAVERLNPTDHEAEEPLDADERLAEHLAVLLGRGTLEARNVMFLLDRFFQKASARRRKHFIWYVGHSLLEQTEPVPADVPRRFQAFWESRNSLAKTDASVREELESFGMWFGCRLFDQDWALRQLELVLTQLGTIGFDDVVVERLAELAPARSAAVMRCFGLLVAGLREPGPVHGWLGSSRIILATALRSEDPETRGEAIRAFHKLGGLGFRASELIAFSSDLNDPAAIAYFTWDAPMTVAEIRKRLAEASEPERDRLLGQILREAKDSDAWRFTTPQEVAQRWPRIEPHLGRRRSFWQLLLGQWKEQGLLAR